MIAQLEPAITDPNSCSRPNHLESVFVEGDMPTSKPHKVKRLLNKKTIRKGCEYATEYLVRWKGYGLE